MLTVHKFGGSSLADFNKMRRAAEIILSSVQRGQQVLAVVSAAGNTTDELSDIARSISVSPSPRELDALLACGEQKSAALLALLLNELGADAVSFTGWQAGILTSATFGCAEIEAVLPGKIKAALKSGQTVIVSGFQGVTRGADISTLGRGGSDTTAVALAAALKAEECRIYTDVNGIYTADPRLIKSAKLLSRIDYRDMLCLSSSGSQVLKEDSVALAMENNLNLRLLSTFEDSPGTEVCTLSEDERPEFAGVTRDCEYSTVTAAGKGAKAEILPSVLDIFGKNNINVFSAGIQDNCFSLKVAREQLLQAMALIHSVLIE